jgi:hypothetical protein
MVSMRFRTLALALALTCGAGITAQAAKNPAAKAARQRAKHNAKVISKRNKNARAAKATVKHKAKAARKKRA